MTGVWLATYESRNYCFEGVGTTEIEAMQALAGATRIHALQCGLEANWAVADLLDVSPRLLMARRSYRDGHELHWPKQD